MDFEMNTALLIHVGALFYIIAFLIRDELKLRLMVLAGSAFYLLYYYLFPKVPLWDAIVTTVILVTANLIILFRILLERSVFGLSKEEKKLFEAFDGFSPGQFRQLLKIAEWKDADSAVSLTRENQLLTKLYYIIKGPVGVTKGNYEFQLDPNSFVGEIAFVLRGSASATVTAQRAARYLEWHTAEIEVLMQKSTSFQNALIALLSSDLADKLATSVQTGGEVIPSKAI